MITAVIENGDASRLDLDDLAARIRAAHEAAEKHQGDALDSAFTAGELLLEAKRRLKHGKWGGWLAEHCRMSDRTARLYMQLMRNREVLQAKRQRVAEMSLRAAVKTIAAYRGAREVRCSTIGCAYPRRAGRRQNLP